MLQAAQVACLATLTASGQCCCSVALHTLTSHQPCAIEFFTCTPGIMVTIIPSRVRYCDTSILYTNMPIMSHTTSPMCCNTSNTPCITSAPCCKTVNLMLIQMSMWRAGIVVMTLLVTVTSCVLCCNTSSMCCNTWTISHKTSTSCWYRCPCGQLALW